MVRVANELTFGQVNTYRLLETLKTFSVCTDKQVAAIAINSAGQIVSAAYNEPTVHCHQCNGPKNKNCARHAEKGLRNLWNDISVYINLFPCEDCQRWLKQQGVNNVYVFGPQHKEDVGLLNITLLPDISAILLNFNGEQKQKFVVQGELGELITAISDSERKDPRMDNIAEEIIDVELQLMILKRVIQNPPANVEYMKKFNKLIRKFNNVSEEC